MIKKHYWYFGHRISFKCSIFWVKRVWTNWYWFLIQRILFDKTCIERQNPFAGIH